MSYSTGKRQPITQKGRGKDVDFDVTHKTCSFCGKQGQTGMRFGGGFGAMICEECVGHYHEVFSSPEKLGQAILPPWERMSDAEVLSNLPLIAQAAEQVTDFLVEWVELARSRDLSWAEIGKALGTSRQAAWERFAQRVAAYRQRQRQDSA